VRLLTPNAHKTSVDPQQVALTHVVQPVEGQSCAWIVLTHSSSAENANFLKILHLS
jgi:hypothetical protein